jgi:hypothetical protein
MMGFTPTFYASRPKLSEVTIDSDLDMGAHNIRANVLRAARVYSPYTTETWPTEELDWGDGDPSSPVVVVNRSMVMPGSPLSTTVFTAVETEEIAVTVINSGSGSESPLQCYIRIDGVDVVELPILEVQESHTVALCVRTGEVVSVQATSTMSGQGTWVTISYVRTGRFVGEKIFDLAGKWLALGIDMHNVPATVTIQGVEMPYSDYAKYFPLAPTELKFPADWGNGRIRPIVEVYK